MNKGAEHGQAAGRRPGERTVPWRAAGAIAALLTIAALTAGCSSSSGPGVASAGPSPKATSSGSSKPGELAYAQCMISHGVKNFPEPNAQGQLKLSQGQQLPDVNSPQFASAMQACKALNPASVAISPSQQAAYQAAQLKYATCMRAHGVPNFPDPANGSFDLGGINVNSPQVQKANSACASSGVGLNQGATS